ncbi:actin cytoskeleton-regulatory complex protein PAN1 isoform X1 [Drosophila subpulchrella]|uniref:actin cytoskeleton-regulatory complex protein PAN1 isoform X1 n=2 Tax=Drosophila subpulchrella TaxID=1486046 RepID=UPI0018A13256|nr:actin cytoskeleton-regulatory complex protein PAN1 isoform X1 [Drosophila subpulchrella]
MEDLTYAYISEPVEFRQLEGRAIDFRKTFDLRGQGGDEMLQLYLRKANLSDDLDRLPAIMRRAYVYDIIRSNKGPGYWVPPSMQVSTDVFAHPPPAVRPPPYYADNVSTNASIDGMKSSSSSNSLDRYTGAPHAVLAGPSFATSVLVSNKGSKYEISGPVNFQHVSGDVTRDRTRNAFDLNADSNDKVLRKYMMERGITEADISDMRRQDVIKKIVHSNFTWMPSKSDIQAQPRVQETAKPLLYATISTNNQITPPPSPPPPPMANVSRPTAAPNFSNYASLTSMFVDISDMELNGPPPAASTPFRQPEVGSVIPVQQQVNRPKVPPPPSAVMAKNTHGYPAAIDIHQVRPSAAPKVSNEIYATIAPQRKVGSMRIPPPAPPKPTIVPNTNSTTFGGSLYAVSPVQYAPVTKPAPVAKPAPPAPPAKPISRVPPAYVSPLPVYNTRAPSAVVPVPPPPPAAASAGAPPPPPPPMPVAAAGGAPPPPPPPPGGLAGVPPPPPMQMSQPKAAPAASSGGDPRDAFLASIRQGVALKKVDQKAATISGIKPRPERKPVGGDFLSELKLGITLRRVKNPADNPYSEESESHA